MRDVDLALSLGGSGEIVGLRAADQDVQFRPLPALGARGDGEFDAGELAQVALHFPGHPPVKGGRIPSNHQRGSRFAVPGQQHLLRSWSHDLFSSRAT
jgi:hypothetical protein